MGRQREPTSTRSPAESLAFTRLVAGVRFTGRKEEQRWRKHSASQGDAQLRNLPPSTVLSTPSQLNDEQDQSLRRKFRIKVGGSDARGVPLPLHSFEELTAMGCSRRLLCELRKAGFSVPTPIQRQAIPAMLSNFDILACATTGSGKTLAYLLPIIMYLESIDLSAAEKKRVLAVVVSPTAELAAQIHMEYRRLIFGGIITLKSCLLRKDTLAGFDFERSPPVVVIGTPLRLNDLIHRKTAAIFSEVKYLIIDEADKLFNESFLGQIDPVFAACTNVNLQRCLFSATLDDRVETLAQSVMIHPVKITIGAQNSVAESITQQLKFVGQEEAKVISLRQMFREGLDVPILIFCESKANAAKLYTEIRFDYSTRVGVIHADMSRHARMETADNFRMGKIWVLIATDVVGRGMDFKGVKSVINYDFPSTVASYIHRIGRAGRAGRPGKAITFFTEDDIPTLRSIANVIRASGCEVQQWMLSIPKRKLREAAKRSKKKEEHKQALRGKTGAKPRSGVKKKENTANKKKLLREFHSLRQKLRSFEEK